MILTYFQGTWARSHVFSIGLASGERKERQQRMEFLGDDLTQYAFYGASIASCPSTLKLEADHMTRLEYPGHSKVYASSFYRIV